jgi:tetratricopeptide (TPR) repeat protein
MDQVSEALTSLKSAGQDTQVEDIQYGEISSALKSKAVSFLSEIGGANRLVDSRHARQPAENLWWWYLDQWVLGQRRKRLRSGGVIIIGVALTVLAIYSLFKWILPSDPLAQEAAIHEQRAESLVMSGDTSSALAEVNLALKAEPEDPILLIFQGSLLQVLDENTAAQRAFDKAELILHDTETFLLERAKRYLRLGKAEWALSDVETAIVANPETAEGYLLKGQALEGLNKLVEAKTAYEKAGSLADAQGNQALVVITRVILGNLQLRMLSEPSDG